MRSCHTHRLAGLLSMRVSSDPGSDWFNQLYSQLPSVHDPPGLHAPPEQSPLAVPVPLSADAAAPMRSAAAFAAAPFVTGTSISTSGFTSVVGVAVWVSVDPAESAEAIAPSPKVKGMLTVGDLTASSMQTLTVMS